MFPAIVLLGGLGVLIGAVLVVASKAFYVYEDPKVVAIDDALPGANCGGCGLPGCNANAQAIVDGLADVNSCVAAGDDVAMAIAEIMGVALTDKEPEFAAAGCYYSLEKADTDYIYSGIEDCRAASLLSGGMKTCRIGCLGLGTCVKACPFDALVIGEDNLPKVDQEKCTGCGTCERICPKNIIRMTSVTRRIMREYTVEECVTPCQRACPTGIDIKEYIGLIKQGDYHGSVQVIKERNPFPTVISRICPAPCEMNCRRLLQDESVAINQLKRFVCDYEMENNDRVLPYKAPPSSKKVAIIGGGVAGLSAAYFSARLGHDSTVFEATSSLGGILRKAISRERLSMDILDWDIQGVVEMGVEVKTNSQAGRDFTINKLLESGYEAVCTATGGWDSRLARGGINQVDTIIPNTYLLIDLLKNSKDNQAVSCGDNVVIIGGDAKITDAVNILKEKGAKNITLVSRKDKKESTLADSTLKDLESQNVPIIYSAGITKIYGQEENLNQAEYIDFKTGETNIIEADTLILASGRFPELIFSLIKPENEDEETLPADQSLPLKWKGVELIKQPANLKEKGLLSDYDVISEYASAVAAINGGRKAAAAMHHVMYGIDFQKTDKIISKTSILQDVESINSVEISARNIIRTNDLQKDPDQEIFQGFSEDIAKDEADRCLRCGLLCYERSQNQANEKITA